MEFEEMKKIWDEQNQKMMFAFDEDSLFNTIKSKSKAASRRISKNEIGLIIINTLVATQVMYDYIISDGSKGYWNLFLSIGIFLTVFYMIFFRNNRQKKENQFKRTMLGELDHAIANTEYSIKLNRLIIVGYFLPVLLFCITKMIYFNASIEKWIMIVGAFLLSFFLIFWDKHKAHLPRKRKLESLRSKLTSEG